MPRNGRTPTERGESQTFYNEFFDVFGVTRRRVASFEEPVKKLGEERGFIDLFWKGVLLVEQKSAGRDLTRDFPNSTLADLYDVDAVPPQLRKALALLMTPWTSSIVPPPSPEIATGWNICSAFTRSSLLRWLWQPLSRLAAEEEGPSDG